MYAFIIFLQNEGMPDYEVRGVVEFHTLHVSVYSGIYTQRKAILLIFVEKKQCQQDCISGFRHIWGIWCC